METDPARRHESLFEIGAEEIPASYLVPALLAMRKFAEETLAAKRLPFKAVRTFGTPRRLTLHITGLAPRSEDEKEENLGPSLAAAKGPDGGWTRAAEGFARSRNVPLSSLQVKATQRGDYVCAVKLNPGRKAEEVLTELFTEMIPSIPFPKRMVWNGSGLKFARPIRALLALYGTRVLRVEAAGLRASNKTFGLCRATDKNVRIASPQSYSGALKNQCVIVDPDARKESIRKNAAMLAKKHDGKVLADEDLLEELTWLVEHPVAILGRFDPGFLSIPQEILILCMKKQQKFLPLTGPEGKLLPFFVGIRNGISEHQDIVRAGYEKVLSARLCDARFFYDEDLKRSLGDFAAQASGIVVGEAAGTVADKIGRMARIAEAFRQVAGAESGADAATVDRAIRLCKFDLVTRVVYEYPELQGTIGGIYARHFGEDEKVALAVREHVLPLTNQGPIPGSPEACVTALCDKLDHLAGNFASGLSPSGSGDPFGMKRQSTGILRVLVERSWDVPLRPAVEKAAELFGRPELLSRILALMSERFQLLMADAGFAVDEIRSVVQNGADADSRDLRVHRLLGKIRALHGVRRHPDFDAVAGAYKRAGNILRQARQKNIAFSGRTFDPALLAEAEEKDLEKALSALSESTRALLDGKRYEDVLLKWVGVRPQLDRFFEKVLVMDPDPRVCSNRLSLLDRLDSEFRQMADFSLITNHA